MTTIKTTNKPAAPATTPAKRLLGRADLKDLGITYSRNHLQRLIARGEFPEPVALGSGAYARKAWRSEDVEQWLAGLRAFAYSPQTAA